MWSVGFIFEKKNQNMTYTWVKTAVIFGNQLFIRTSSVFSHSLIMLPQKESRSIASPLKISKVIHIESIPIDLGSQTFHYPKLSQLAKVMLFKWSLQMLRHCFNAGCRMWRLVRIFCWFFLYSLCHGACLKRIHDIKSYI